MSDVAVGARAFNGARAPRWMVVLLITSLALNLLVLGLVGSLVWRMRGPAPWTHAVTPNLLGYTSTLPADRRKQLWERSDKELQHIRPFRREVRSARQETIKALAAEPFDRQQFVAAQARQMEAENRAREAVQNLYVTIAESLTAEERRGFQRWREHRRPAFYNLLDEPDKKPDADGKR
jgi:uncharacterized membrane protein